MTLLDQDKLGLHLTVYSAIRKHEHTADWFNRFYKMVSSMPNVMEVHRLSVDLYDVSSSFSMEKIKYTTALPLDHL